MPTKYDSSQHCEHQSERLKEWVVIPRVATSRKDAELRIQRRPQRRLRRLEYWAHQLSPTAPRPAHKQCQDDCDNSHARPLTVGSRQCEWRCRSCHHLLNRLRGCANPTVHDHVAHASSEVAHGDAFTPTPSPFQFPFSLKCLHKKMSCIRTHLVMKRTVSAERRVSEGRDARRGDALRDLRVVRARARCARTTLARRPCDAPAPTQTAPIGDVLGLP